MKPRTLFYLTALSLFATGLVFAQPAKNVQNETTPKNPIEIRIIPESAAMDVPVSEVLDSVRYVPLETTKASTFGSISQLAATKDYFVILDATLTRSVLLFQRSGKFYKKIDTYNGKPFSSLYSIHVDEFAGKLIIMGRVGGMAASQFDFTLKGEQLPLPAAHNFDDLHTFSNHHTAFAYNINQPFNIVMADSLGNTLQQLQPTEKNNLEEDEIVSNNETFFYDNDTAVFFVKPYDYNIYTLNQNHQLSISYRFVFPLNITLSHDFVTNDANKGKRIAMRTGKIYTTDFFFAKGNTVAFKLMDSDLDLLTYNVQSGMLSSVNHLQPDKASYYLPVTEFISRTYSGQQLYSSVSALEMFNAAQKIKGQDAWKNSLSPAMKTFFEKGDQYTNPVISILYFKP